MPTRWRRDVTEVVIVQPYLPRYRLPFFDGLFAALRADGVKLRVIAGEASKEQAQRGDSALASWLEQVPTRTFSVGSRNLNLTRTSHLWRDSDAVIVPHQGSSLDALLATVGRHPRRVGVWGHIASYTSPLNPVDGAIERWQLRHAQHVFAYMPGGAAFARGHGVPAERITTVMNTIDTTSLQAALARTTSADIAAFREQHDIPDAQYLSYVGGLDRSKKVDVLADSLDVLHSRGSDVHVVVAGRGEQEHLLRPAAARGQVTLVGYADVDTKAVILKGSAAIANPGRVGLIAVDALTARRAIITTQWPWHAPEIEYLRLNESLIMPRDNAADFADALETATRSTSNTMPTEWPAPPRMESMVANFRNGIIALLTS